MEEGSKMNVSAAYRLRKRKSPREAQAPRPDWM